MDSTDDLVTPQIETESALRKLISDYPKMLDKRLQPELDRYCLELISHSVIAVVACNDSSTPMFLLAKDDILVRTPKLLTLPLANKAPAPGSPVNASLYFLVPGIGHALRVNGSIAKTGTLWTMSITCSYLHCARAAARAELWKIRSSSKISTINPNISPKDFIEASPYLLLKTVNSSGQTELSPRGDESGFVTLIDQRRIFIPERPGNKVAISMRNIIANGHVEVLMLLPHSNFIMHIRGRASLSSNDHLLAKSVVKGKHPKLGILVTHCEFSITENRVINDAELWSNNNHVDENRITRFSKALSIHMNGAGLLGKLSAPVVDAVVKNDMKHLY